MFSYGTWTGIFKKDLKGTIEAVKNYGFNCVQLELEFSELGLSYNDALADNLTVEKCHIIRDAFRDAKVPIVSICGYANLMTPDPDVRKMNDRRLKVLLKYARELGTPYVVSESGGLSKYNDDNWIWDWKKENENREVFDEAVEMLREYSKFAYDHGSVFLLENYRNGIVGTIDHVNEVFARIDHPGLGLLMDPCNYFNEENIDRMDDELNRMFDTLGSKIKIAHAKDIKRFDDPTKAPIGSLGGRMLDLPHAGAGVLNYELYLKRLYDIHPNIPLIIEHITDLNQIPFSMSYVDKIAKKVGC